MKPQIDDSDPPAGWCSECGRECSDSYVDHGYSYGDHGKRPFF